MNNKNFELENDLTNIIDYLRQHQKNNRDKQRLTKAVALHRTYQNLQKKLAVPVTISKLAEASNISRQNLTHFLNFQKAHVYETPEYIVENVKSYFIAHQDELFVKATYNKNEYYFIPRATLFIPELCSSYSMSSDKETLLVIAYLKDLYKKFNVLKRTDTIVPDGLKYGTKYRKMRKPDGEAFIKYINEKSA